MSKYRIALIAGWAGALLAFSVGCGEPGGLGGANGGSPNGSMRVYGLGRSLLLAIGP